MKIEGLKGCFEKTDGFIPGLIQKYGFKEDGSVQTDFDVIEMDEGRWYPDMWQDAWKSATLAAVSHE